MYDRTSRPAATIAILGVFAVGLALLLLGIATEPALRVAPTALQLGDVAPGTTHAVAFDCYNASSHNVRILGAFTACQEVGCLTMPDRPIVVPPGETRRIEGTFDARRPGRIDYSCLLYTDAPYQGEVALKLEGFVHAARVAQREELAQSP